MGQQSTTHENIRAARVIGTNVYNADGNHLGVVDDIIIGKRGGQVKYVIMGFGGFLGIGEEYLPMPWAELKYSEKHAGYVIARSRQELEGAPRFSATNEPDWTDSSYGEKVHRYYDSPLL